MGGAPDYNNRGQACWRVAVCLLTNWGYYTRNWARNQVFSGFLGIFEKIGIKKEGGAPESIPSYCHSFGSPVL